MQTVQPSLPSLTGSIPLPLRNPNGCAEFLGITETELRQQPWFRELRESWREEIHARAAAGELFAQWAWERSYVRTPGLEGSSGVMAPAQCTGSPSTERRSEIA